MKLLKSKRVIYFRTFAWLLSIWLVLMLGCSGYLLQEAKKAAQETFGKDINTVNSFIDDTVLEIALWNHEFFTEDFNYAIYSEDCNLIYDTRDTLLCGYDIPTGTKLVNQEYGFLYPEKWFTEEEVKELKYYIAYTSNSTTYGDLYGYDLHIFGWADGLEIIPDKIRVVAMYISGFDDEGAVNSACSHSQDSDFEFESGYKNTKGLTRYSFIHIVNSYTCPVQESKTHLEVIDNERLKNSVANFGKDITENTLLKTEKIGLFSERYYTVLPSDFDSAQNKYWIAFSGESHYLTDILPALLIVWLICLGVFTGSAWILSSQTWKTYLKQEELEQQRKDTTNAIAHDLKTPLAAISGYSENLINNVHTEKRAHYAARIQDNVHRMDNIVREILSLSHLESGMQKISKEEQFLNELTKSVVSAYEDDFAEKEIVFSIVGEGKITADKALISRAINNFVSNAVANTAQKGKIEILITDHRWSIMNTGNPIPKDQLKSIWQAYYKTNVARSNPRSSGLGLSIVKSIMDLHGFTYGLENTLNGVRFWFDY